MRKTKICFALILLFVFAACENGARTVSPAVIAATETELPQTNDNLPREVKSMLAGALEQTRTTKSYDPAYAVLKYPNGDVPAETGVCSDVVIRALRKADVDLQSAVHEDMTKNFAAYPQKWGLKRPDANIDHRRVPNLMTFFTRQNKSLTITNKPEDYQPGDIVIWDLDGKGLTHIGIVSNLRSDTSKRFLIFHNIGRGAEAEDVLFDWKIIGHYRYF